MKKILLFSAIISLWGTMSQDASAQCINIDSVVKTQSTATGNSLDDRTIRVYYEHTSGGKKSASISYSLDGDNFTALPCLNIDSKDKNKTHDFFDVEINAVPSLANIYFKLEAHSAPNCNGKACSITTFFGNEKLQKHTTLPVDLVSFVANETSCNTVLLQWTTVNQENFSHFEVEYSPDGKNFSRVRNIWANQSSQENHYSVTLNQSNKNGYYRLKMVDVNQSYKLSQVKAVTLSCVTNNALDMVLSPNPVYNQVNIKGTNSQQVIKIFNAQNMLVQELRGREGNTTIDVNQLTPGLYNAIVIDGKQRTNLRFIKR